MAWLNEMFNWIARMWRPSEDQLRYRQRVKEAEEYRNQIRQAKSETIEQIKQRAEEEAVKIREQERLREHGQLEIVREAMVELGEIISAANAQANHLGKTALTTKCPECLSLIKYSGRLIGREIECTNQACGCTIQLNDHQ